VGYLLAGLIVGPYTPGFVADRGLTSAFAELGVILLMFGVGLHFHLKDLLAVRTVAILGALAQISVATMLGAWMGRGFGWSWSGGLVFGLALSVASTVVLTRVLADNQNLHTPTGRIAIGWLVVEDIFTVVVLVLLPAVFATTTSSAGDIVFALLVTIAKIAIFVCFTFFFGERLIPKILNGIASTHSRELFTLTVLVLALGIAVGSAMLFGVSMALGAFLAGTIVGQSEFSLRAATDALPMRDAFAVLFFVSVGMAFDPSQLMESPALLLFTVLIILVGKPLAAFLIVRVLGYGSAIAAGVAAALSQIGEFSLILAALGDELAILPRGASNVIVAASILTIAVNPLFYRFAASLRPRGIQQANDPLPPVEDYKAVVVGYGPIGQTVARLLRDGGLAPVIVEMNIETVRRIRKEGYRAVYGDAVRPEVLESAGIGHAVAMIISGPTSDQTTEIIQNARLASRSVRVLARAHYLQDIPGIRKAGADQVFSGEGEVALAMTEYILGLLGSPPEHMDRERQRVRTELAQS